MSLSKTKCTKIAEKIKEEIWPQIENLRVSYSPALSPLQNILQSLKTEFDNVESLLCEDRNIPSYAEQMDKKIADSLQWAGTAIEFNSSLVQPGTHPRLFPIFYITDISKVIPSDGICMKYLPYVLASFYWNSQQVYSWWDGAEDERLGTNSPQWMHYLTMTRDDVKNNGRSSNLHKERIHFSKLFTLENFMERFKGQDCHRMHQKLKSEKTTNKDIYSEILSTFCTWQVINAYNILLFFYENILLHLDAQLSFQGDIERIRNSDATNEEKKQDLYTFLKDIFQNETHPWYDKFNGDTEKSRMLKDSANKYLAQLKNLPAHKLSEVFCSLDKVFEKDPLEMVALQGRNQERFFFYHKCQYMAFIYLLCAYVCTRNNEIRAKVDFEGSYMLFQEHTRAFDIQMYDRFGVPIDSTLKAYLEDDENRSSHTVMVEKMLWRISNDDTPESTFSENVNEEYHSHELFLTHGENLEEYGVNLLINAMRCQNICAWGIDEVLHQQMDKEFQSGKEDVRHLVYEWMWVPEKDDISRFALVKYGKLLHYADIYFRAVFMHRGLHKYGEAKLDSELMTSDLESHPEYLKYTNDMSNA